MVTDTIALRRKMSKMIKRMQNNAFAGAFARWMEFISELKQSKFQVGKAVKMMLNRVVGGAFQRWKEMAGRAPYTSPPFSPTTFLWDELGGNFSEKTPQNGYIKLS